MSAVLKPTRMSTGIPPASEGDLSISALLKRLIAETGELVRAEANVIKLEMQESTRGLILDGIKATISAGVAFLGVLCLVAFLVIALGDLLTRGAHDVRGFWLSALIIGALLSGGGGYMAYRHIKRFGKDLRLPETKHALRTDTMFVKEELEKIKEASLP